MNHLTDELLNEYLDDVLANRAEIEGHLADCADCTARLTALKNLFTEIETLPEVKLSRDLAAPVLRKLGKVDTSLPRWLTLTIGMQAALALIVAVIATPFLIQFASTSMPGLQLPSLTQAFMQIQAQWTMWLDMLSQIQMPSMPEIPVEFEASSIYMLLAVAGVSVLWLVGNGLLLRNQTR